MAIVLCRHELPVRFVPRGGRHERIGTYPMSTPVELMDGDARDFSFLCRDETTGRSYHEHAWSLWCDVPLLRGTLSGEDLSAWLPGGWPLDEPAAETAFGTATMTAWQLSAGGYARTFPTEGDVDQALASRAALALASTFEDDVRVVRGEVLVRSKGPFVSFQGTGVSTQHAVGAGWDRCPFAIPERAHELWRFLHDRRALSGYSIAPFDLPGVARAIPAGLLGDADLEAYANLLPILAFETLASLATRTRSDATRDGLLGARAALTPLVLECLIGLVDLRDAEQALRAAGQCMELAAESVREAEAARHHWPSRIDGDLPAEHVEHLRVVMLPRLASTRELTHDDAAAMAGL